MKETAVAAYRIQDLEENERPPRKAGTPGSAIPIERRAAGHPAAGGRAGENAVQVGQRLLAASRRSLRPAPGGLPGSVRPARPGRGQGRQIKAAIELGRRLTLESPEERPSIHSPQDAADLVMYEMSALEQEHLRVILLDTRNRVLHIEEVYRGSLNSSQVRVGELFKAAIRRNAAAIIVVHNHPSGDPSPSPDDVAMTRAIVQAGKLLDIDVLDHLVIGRGRFVSLKERGLGFG